MKKVRVICGTDLRSLQTSKKRHRWYRDLLGAERTIDRTPGIHPGKGGSTGVEKRLGFTSAVTTLANVMGATDLDRGQC
jgi:hypothetical protein